MRPAPLHVAKCNKAAVNVTVKGASVRIPYRASRASPFAAGTSAFWHCCVGRSSSDLRGHTRVLQGDAAAAAASRLASLTVLDCRDLELKAHTVIATVDIINVRVCCTLCVVACRVALQSV